MDSIEGSVNNELEPIVQVRLLAGAELDCVVDTGFSGALVLPLKIVRKLDLPIVGYEFPLEMVGGEETKAALAIAEIEWLGNIRPVFVIVKDENFLAPSYSMTQSFLLIIANARSRLLRERVEAESLN